MRWVRRFCIALFVIYAVPGVFAAYRAWVQVRSLDLVVPTTDLRNGDTIRVRTVSWARTWVTVRLLLLQGNRVDTLATHVIDSNLNASLDPRWRRDSIIVVLSPSLLERYERGNATVRARAIGGPQWFRTPPPLVREATVRLEPTR